MPHSITNKTPFRLTFGTEAVIPVEIGELSPRTTLFQPSQNEEELRENLDLLQEAREVAHIKEYVVKARAAKRQDKKLLSRQFKCQDLVLRKITRTTDDNKLTPNWEGPFRVVENVGRGAYRLEQLDGWSRALKEIKTHSRPVKQGWSRALEEIKTHRRSGKQGWSRELEEIKTHRRPTKQGWSRVFKEIETHRSLSKQGWSKALEEMKTDRRLAKQGWSKVFKEIKTHRGPVKQG
ncbi:hypothetical protein CR513_35583, partial [Mucuna pruriens]